MQHPEQVILMSPLKAMIPIIKVVGDFCNLRCNYCFYNTEDQSTRHVMSHELLENFINQFMELFTGTLVFIWHGGEPLLAGLSFFERVIEVQKNNLKTGQVIQNSIQTNATLINDEWASFFKDNHFRVGVSLDGDKESHDRFRKTLGKVGSFNKALQGINILRRHGISPGFIQTITHDNVSRVKEDFRFFVNVLGATSWGLNTFFDVEKLNMAMLAQSITNEELTTVLKTYIDLWLAEDDSDLRIREIENFISAVFGKRSTSCTFNGSCTGYFCLEFDGRIYPCDRLSNRQELLFGDLSREPLLKILNGTTRLMYANKVNSLHPDCANCEWQKACHNGCTHHRIGGVGGKYFFCETRKAVFSYLKQKVNDYDTNKWRADA